MNYSSRPDINNKIALHYNIFLEAETRQNVTLTLLTNLIYQLTILMFKDASNPPNYTQTDMYLQSTVLPYPKAMSTSLVFFSSLPSISDSSVWFS